MVFGEQKVDVIIPTYNRGYCIEKSIRSILDQSYKSFHIYVIDDASDDNTECVVRGMKDERITYYKMPNKSGANKCRNKGIQLSEAKYIAFNDSDDIWEKHKLEKQMEVIQSKKEGLVFSTYLRKSAIDDMEPEVVGVCSDEEKKNIKKLLIERNVIGTPTMLLTREMIQNVGFFDEKLPRFQDWEMCIRISKYYPIYYIAEPLVRTYLFGDNITNNTKYLKEAYLILSNRYIDEIREYKMQNVWFHRLIDAQCTYEEIELFAKNAGLSDLEIKHEYYTYLMREKNLKNSISENYQLVCSWLNDQQKVVDRLNNLTTKRVAIYGNGNIGKILGNVIEEKTSICIAYYIDKNDKNVCRYPLVNLDTFLETKESIPILNSVPQLDTYLKDTVKNNEVISLGDLIRKRERK